MNTIRFKTAAAIATLIAATAISTTASANPFNPFEALFGPHAAAGRRRRPTPIRATTARELRADFRRQIVNYRTNEAPGTIIIDTPNTYLYLVMPGGKAMRYGIGVGREGFTWSGVQDDRAQGRVAGLDAAGGDDRSASPTCRASWPAARPTRSARAPCISAARSTASTAPTRPHTIGQRVSSGCIRMINEDVIDLYSRVNVGTKVVVLPMSSRRAATATGQVY